MATEKNAPDPLTDPAAVIEQLRAARTRRRRSRYSRSKLDRHRAEIAALRRAGASYSDITDWLRTSARPRIRAARSTVVRYVMSLPELQDQDDG